MVWRAHHWVIGNGDWQDRCWGGAVIGTAVVVAVTVMCSALADVEQRGEQSHHRLVAVVVRWQALEDVASSASVVNGAGLFVVMWHTCSGNGVVIDLASEDDGFVVGVLDDGRHRGRCRGSAVCGVLWSYW